MIDLSSIQARDPLREEHDSLIEEFLAKGGEIKQVGRIERPPPKQEAWNTTITSHPERRRAFLELEEKIAAHGKALASTGLTAEQAVRQLRKRWGSQCTISLAKVEQLAARYGYYYSEKPQS
jgi:hypothetical protein